jgi:hypothetical protein
MNYSPIDILKMQLGTVALAIEKAVPHILEKSDTVSTVLRNTIAVGAMIAVDIRCPLECTLYVKDNILAIQRILEPFATLKDYTNETAGIVCENINEYLKKINMELY